MGERTKMSNDNGLVDEFEKLQKQKEEIELKEKDIKNKLIEMAKQKNVEVLFGNHKKCVIKEYDKVVYPEDKSQLIGLMKQKGIYERFSMINYMGFNMAILKGGIDKEITDLTKKEKAFRLSLKEI